MVHVQSCFLHIRKKSVPQVQRFFANCIYCCYFFTLLVLFTLSLKLLDFIFSLRKLLALTVCMRNPEIPGRIQIERFIQVEIPGKK